VGNKGGQNPTRKNSNSVERKDCRVFRSWEGKKILNYRNEKGGGRKAYCGIIREESSEKRSIYKQMGSSKKEAA